jgi:hypothetical protein
LHPPRSLASSSPRSLWWLDCLAAEIVTNR